MNQSDFKTNTFKLYNFDLFRIIHKQLFNNLYYISLLNGYQDVIDARVMNTCLLKL